MMNWLRSHMPTQRRLIQLYAALLHNAHIKGFIQGDIYTGSAKALCLPGLNCYSCPGAISACPLGALQNALASSGQRAPVYVLGILMLFGLTLGRTICGYLCPAGLMQELLYKIPTPKIKKSPVTRALSWLKYGILLIFVIILPLWYALQRFPLPAFCKYICPAGTFEGAIGLLSNPVNADKLSMLGFLFTSKFLIMMLVAAACVFIYRAFCRFLCPLGAIYGLFARVAVIGVKVEAPKCVSCGLCVNHCRMDVRRVGDHECIHCGECIEVCPTHAIAFKAGKITLHANETGMPAPVKVKRRRSRAAAWIAALLVLAGALWFFNQPEDVANDPAVIVDDGTPVGKDAGMRAPDFTVPLYGGGSFTLSEQRGKVTVVNFWATWCGPCIKELPYFDELYRQYGNEVAVVAIHCDLITDDVEQFLDRFDYQLPFALDETGEVIKSFGGSTMLPQTIVIDQSGKIVYNQVKSMTYEALEALIAPLLEE